MKALNQGCEEVRKGMESFHYYLLFPNAFLGTGKLMHGSVKKAQEKLH